MPVTANLKDKRTVLSVNMSICLSVVINSITILRRLASFLVHTRYVCICRNLYEQSLRNCFRWTDLFQGLSPSEGDNHCMQCQHPLAIKKNNP